MVLSVRQLSVHAGKRCLLNNISFDVERGELLGLFGASGAGKSTILLTIQGLQAAHFRVSGSIRFQGKLVEGLPPEKRSMAGISIVLQGLGLFPDRTVLQNVVYPLTHRGKSGKEARRLGLEQLAALHILDFAARYPHEISGGQQQRVALARAMVFEPSLLLLDEPFKGLEQEMRDQLLGLVRSLALRGTSIIFVTHDRRELDLAADTAIRIDAGQVREVETRSDARASGPFALTERRLLIGSNSRLTSVGLSQVCLVPMDAGVAPEQSITEGEIVELRSLPMDRVAVLLRYRSGEIGVIECPSGRTASLRVGQVVALTHREEQPR